MSHANPCDKVSSAFEEALASFAKNEQGASWTVAACDQTAAQFEDIGAQSCSTPAALYNAGVVRERCGQLDRAIAAYARVLSAQPDYYPARARLAIHDLDAHASASLDPAIDRLELVSSEPGDMQPELLAALAWGYLRRAQAHHDAEDLARAAAAIERGLLTDENHPRVLHAQIALQLVLAERRAKKEPGELTVEEPPPAFSAAEGELLAQTCSAALRRAPNDAAIHEVCGVVAAEQRDLAQASERFQDAFRLEPSRLSAHLNYAATCLALRDISGAEKAYRRALDIDPHSFVARLGLATALGHNEKSTPQELEEAVSLLETQPGDPGALEALYNRALLERSRARASNDDIEMLTHTRLQRDLLLEFIARAANDPRMAPAVSVAEHKLEVEATICLLIEGPFRGGLP